MSHERPLPEAAVAPWPAHPAPQPVSAKADPPKAAKGRGKADDKRSNAAWIAAGVGVGIGSAAIVAALLYTSRPKGKKR